MSRTPLAALPTNIPSQQRRPLTFPMKAGPSRTLSLTNVSNVNAVPFPASEQLVTFPATSEEKPAMNCLDLLRPTTRKRVQSQSAGSTIDNESLQRTFRRSASVISSSSSPTSSLSKSPRRRRSSSSLSLSNKVKASQGRKRSKLATDVQLAGMVHRSISAELQRRKKAQMEWPVSSEALSDIDMDVDADMPVESMMTTSTTETPFDLMVQDTMLAARLHRFLHSHGKGRPAPPPHHLCQMSLRPSFCPPILPPSESQEPPLPFDALVASLTLRYRAKSVSKVRRSLDERTRQASPLSVRLV